MEHVINILSLTFPYNILIKYITSQHASIEQWSTVFYLSAMFYLIGGLVFLIWASGERQPWAYTPEQDQLLVTPGTEKEQMIFPSKKDDLEKNKYGSTF